jgi:hypothetical protein
MNANPALNRTAAGQVMHISDAIVRRCRLVRGYTSTRGAAMGPVCHELAPPATLCCFRLDCFASQSYFVAQSKQP